MDIACQTNPQTAERLDYDAPVRPGGIPSINLWSVEESGDWRTDNERGRLSARELIERMRSQATPFLLGHVAKGIAQRGRHGGVEVGFFAEIAETTIYT